MNMKFCKGCTANWRNQLLTDGAKLFERDGVDHAGEHLKRESRKLKETIGEQIEDLVKWHSMNSLKHPEKSPVNQKRICRLMKQIIYIDSEKSQAQNST